MQKITNTQQGARQAEAGMVSILITMIMMVVITLIIIGISQVTRSNQREQLDRQLSSQAYYAAESGLNQAVKFFTANPSAGLNTTGNCTQFITNATPNGLGGTVGTTNVLDTNTNVSYTCLMVNSTPTSLQKAPLTEDSNTVWHIKDASGATFTSLRLKWKFNTSSPFAGSATTDACANAAGTYPQYGNWKCTFGILRIDLVDVQGTVTTNPSSGGTGNGLEVPAKTLFLVPFYGGGTNSLALSGNTGQVTSVLCVRGGICDLTLTGTASGDYYARLTMIYQDSDSVTLTATDASGPASFAGGQAVIDVTGKAQDELRRVQARIPLNMNSSPIPNFAVSSTEDICKLIAVAPGANTVNSCP